MGRHVVIPPDLKTTQLIALAVWRNGHRNILRIRRYLARIPPRYIWGFRCLSTAMLLFVTWYASPLCVFEENKWLKIFNNNDKKSFSFNPSPHLLMHLQKTLTFLPFGSADFPCTVLVYVVAHSWLNQSYDHCYYQHTYIHMYTLSTNNIQHTYIRMYVHRCRFGRLLSFPTNAGKFVLFGSDKKRGYSFITKNCNRMWKIYMLILILPISLFQLPTYYLCLFVRQNSFV
jgi:hypothetical protein